MKRVGYEEIGRRIYKPRIIDYPLIEKGQISIFGNNMRQCRLLLGLNREQMAYKLGVSSSQYRKYEEGKSWMQMHTIMYFALRVGMPFTYLFSSSIYYKLCSLTDAPKQLMPIQAYVNRCSDRQFEIFRMLLDELFGEDGQHTQYCIKKSLPQNKDIYNELDNYYNIIAKGLVKFRNSTRLSCQDLADLLGIDRRTLSSYEKIDGNKRISVLMAMRFWASTGVNPLWLLRDTLIYKKSIIQILRMVWIQKRLHEFADTKIEKIIEIVKLIDTEFIRTPSLPYLSV